MTILGDIERLINEHGSAAVLRERLALAKDEHAALEKKVATFQEENATLKSENQHLELDNYKLKEKIGNLEKQLAEIQGKASEVDKVKEGFLAVLSKISDDISTEELASIAKMSVEAAKFHLVDLKEMGFIDARYYEGGAHWYLKQEGRKYLHPRGLLK